MRHLVWSQSDTLDTFSPTAHATLFEEPPPQPMASDFLNREANITIARNPELFKIVSPIHVSRLWDLLMSHPNQPLVESLCWSFIDGFWPWADATHDDYPITWDFSSRPPKSEDEAQFIRDQRDIELSADHFSSSFGPDLLPGMYSSPIHAVPRPRSAKLRLVTDHSASTFSLNSLINRSAIAGCKMDTITNLGNALLQYRRVHGDKPLILFKSDVSAAYRRLPVHPLWQIKQINMIDGERYVDRCLCFGSRGSPHCYTVFMGCIVYICVEVERIGPIFAYMDDNFSFEEDGDVLWYEPYGQFLPTRQVRLLRVWDDIGIPHESSKQEYALTLHIIGFLVDPNKMTVCMDAQDRMSLVEPVRSFISVTPGGTRRPLREFQQLAGYLNWSLNVFPLLRPALSTLYDKMRGKTKMFAGIHISRAIIDDLKWFLTHVEHSDGVHMFDAVEWGPSSAHLVAYSDVSLSRLGIFFPSLDLGLHSDLPREHPAHGIFYFEALTALSALIEAVTHVPSSPRIVIFSDNMDTINIFSSLSASPVYNPILKHAVSLIIKHRVSLHVLHILGIDNVVANALSRQDFRRALAAHPSLTLSSFSPPRLTLGQPTT